MNAFDADWPVVGMVHLPPLPGAPGFESREQVRTRARADASALQAGGVNALLVENFGDAPFYPDNVPKAVVAEMAAIVSELDGEVDLPIGVNVLRNDATAALAVAAATGASFIRVNIHVGTRSTDQGLIEGRAHETMRLRDTLDAEVSVFADLRVKHSAPVGERPIEAEFAEVVDRGLADAVVVSGPATGDVVETEGLTRVSRMAEKADTPVFVGSGVTPETVETVVEHADGAIVGSGLKVGGETTNPVDEDRVRSLKERVKECT